MTVGLATRKRACANSASMSLRNSADVATAWMSSRRTLARESARIESAIASWSSFFRVSLLHAASAAMRRTGTARSVFIWHLAYTRELVSHVARPLPKASAVPASAHSYLADLLGVTELSLAGKI